MSTASRELLLKIAHCPVLAECLGQRKPDHNCAKVLLSQWERRAKTRDEGKRTTDERLGYWWKFHQLPTPWVGHLATAPLLFVSSNPGLGGVVPENPATAEPKAHWVTLKTSEAEIVKRYEDGPDPEVRTQRYWVAIEKRAQELFEEKVTPGTHYALTEVARCGSPDEQTGGVLEAARHCHRQWLMPTLEAASNVRVVIGVGEHAKRALPKVLPSLEPESRVQEVDISGRAVLVTFIPGPGAAKDKTFATTHDPWELTRLVAALRASTV